MRHSIDSIKQSYSPVITIYGSSTCAQDSLLYKQAFDLGKGIANLEKYSIATGGYTGTMDAISKGANSNLDKGKKNIGILGITTDQITRFEPSKYLTEEFREITLMTRLEVLQGIADKHIFLAGSTGTLTELSLLWDKQKLGILPLKPIFLLGKTWHTIFDIMFEQNQEVPKSPWKLDIDVKNNTKIVHSIEDLVNNIKIE